MKERGEKSLTEERLIYILSRMEAENEPKKEKNYGRVGCIIGVVIIVIVIILIVTGLINIPEMT